MLQSINQSISSRCGRKSMNVGETHLNYWYKRHCKFASFDRLERLFHSGESRAAAALAFHFGRRRKSGLKKMEIESSLSTAQVEAA